MYRCPVARRMTLQKTLGRHLKQKKGIRECASIANGCVCWGRRGVLQPESVAKKVKYSERSWETRVKNVH
jgi:hypothetical protein